MAIVARTIKGWGAPSLYERSLHGKAVSGDELERVLDELRETAQRLGARWSAGDLRAPAPIDATVPPREPTQPPPYGEALRRFAQKGDTHDLRDVAELQKGECPRFAVFDGIPIALDGTGRCRRSSRARGLTLADPEYAPEAVRFFVKGPVVIAYRWETRPIEVLRVIVGSLDLMK